MEDLACPVCKQDADDTCEHMVYFASNECGLIYVAEQYREKLSEVTEQLMGLHGELEEGEGVSEDDFPCEYLDELQERLNISHIVYDEYYDMPPSGLAMYAAFILPDE